MMDSGTCRIYTVTDAAENGEMPNPTLHEYGDYEWSFEDRMISYSRQYAAMGADQQIDRIIRIWRCAAIWKKSNEKQTVGSFDRMRNRTDRFEK